MTDSYQQSGDPEALHQLRIAVRRTRTALRLFEGYSERESDQTRSALRVLAGQLGVVRDLDVVLAQVTRWQERAPARLRERLTTLWSTLEADCTTARRSLSSALAAAAYPTRVEAANVPVHERDASDEPLRDAARRSLVMRWGRVRQHGRKLHQGSPAAALHRLRIHNKRLRDALECFAPLFPEHAAYAAPYLQRLHDDLGEHQDAELAERWLNAQVLGTRRKKDRAAVWLLRRIGRKKRRTQARALRSLRRARRLEWDWLVPPGLPKAAAGGVTGQTSTIEMTEDAGGEVHMMELYVIRHAIAFDRDPAQWPDDRLRPLTP
ncbi:MAG: CHAD domain-containing protein, partial [Chloroflexota bacterium]